MVAQDFDFFFREWEERAPGERRSTARARALADAFDLTCIAAPVLTVVGSKGKGTAAAFASAYLAAAGLEVVTVTSPGYRTNRERVRGGGRALAESTLAALAERLRAGIRRLPGREAYGGYLSPSGLFVLAGLLHARSVGADAVVLEAGRGGRSDEVSLFAPALVAVTSVFGEHLGELGDTPPVIAADKAAVAAETTRAVLTLPQTPDVERAVVRAVAERTREQVAPQVVHPGDSGIRPGILPQGLGRANAELGCLAARRLLDVTARRAPSPARLAEVLASVSLPGRLSWHTVPGTSTRVLVDTAINGAGAAAALAAAQSRWGGVDHVLVSLPDDKDLPGVAAELASLPVTFVRLPARHLRFARPLPTSWDVVAAEALGREVVAALGGRVVALGTVSFVAAMLDLVDADTERLFIA